MNANDQKQVTHTHTHHGQQRLASSLFKQGERFVVGVVGVQWAGPKTENEFVMTTTLENAKHGASSQSTILTRQLHRTSQKEGRLPRTLYIGADNTPKETKNSTTAVWAVFMLAALQDTSLERIEFQYPLVGHTHGNLDRFFSRLCVGLRGRSYFTFQDLEDIVSETLKGFSVGWDHHGSSYEWEHVRSLLGIEFTRYRNIHCLSLYRDSQGLFAQWKQYVSDETWSRPTLLLRKEQMDIVARARPPLLEHQFNETQRPKHSHFLDRLEAWIELVFMRGS